MAGTSGRGGEIRGREGRYGVGRSKESTCMASCHFPDTVGGGGGGGGGLIIPSLPMRCHQALFILLSVIYPIIYCLFFSSIINYIYLCPLASYIHRKKDFAAAKVSRCMVGCHPPGGSKFLRLRHQALIILTSPRKATFGYPSPITRVP